MKRNSTFQGQEVFTTFQLLENSADIKVVETLQLW